MLDATFTDDMAARAREAAQLMKTLSNEGRLMILCLLVEGERTVAGLSTALGIAQPQVSQQLARLRHEGYVRTRRDGRSVHYSLADPRVQDVLTALHEAFCPDRT